MYICIFMIQLLKNILRFQIITNGSIKPCFNQAVTLPPIGWSVVGVDQWAGMKTISWAWTKGLAKSPMVSNGLVMGALDRASRGSMVNEQLKLSTEFVSFSCMGKKKVTCQLPAGCKWYIFRSNWQLISEILPLIC